MLSSISHFGSARSNTNPVGSVTSSMYAYLSNKDNMVTILIVVAFVVLVIMSILYKTSEGFSSKLNDIFGSWSGSGSGSGPSAKSLKDLDVIVFTSPTCPWCKKQKDVLSKEGALSSVEIVDVSTEDGRKKAEQYGATKGLPTFVSKALKTGDIGFKETVAEIVAGLTKVAKETRSAQAQVQDKGRGQVQEDQPQSQSQINPDDVQALQIVMFYRDGCGYCTKAKADAKLNGVLPFLELQDTNSPEGQQALKNMGIENTGVPLFVSRATGKRSVGYKPFNQIMLDLTKVD
jgi:glutaredoxin